MKQNFLKNIALAISLIGIGAFSSAYAAGTASGTTINNSANISYSIGGVAQAPVVSNTVSFVVDNRVTMTLVDQGTFTSVAPGSVDQITTFTLTNTGNTIQDYLLTVNQALTGTLYTRTDNFDVTACTVFSDTNANGLYEPLTDTRTYVDELAPDAQRAVFVKCNVPAGRLNNDFSIVGLSARAAIGGTANTQGAALTQTAGAKVLNTVAIVFGDIAGTDDVARDGLISSRSAYLVSAATISFTKTVAPICDPFNFNVNPKLIPGGYARYQLSIANDPAASASANLTTISDTLVGTLTFDNNLVLPTASACSAAAPESAAGQGFKITCTGTTRACNTTPIYVPTTGNYTAPNISLNLNTYLPAETGYTAGQIKPGETINIIFNAVVN